MAKKFAEADIVRVKSGGPHMTVAGYGGELHGGNIRCQWFVKDQLKEGYFPEAVLEKMLAPSNTRLAVGAATIH